MTWTVDHPHRRTVLHHGERVHRVRVYRPMGVAGMGILAALFGAWAAIVGFVGPEFGYQATSNTSWQWTTANWLLHLIPGAVAFVAGLTAVAFAGAVTFSGRTLLRLSGLVIVAAGAWLVIGPALWPVFESGSPYGYASTAQTSFTYQIGANLGPGLLLVALGAMIFEAVTASRITPAYEGPAGAVAAPAGGVESPTGVLERPAGAVESPAGAEPADAVAEPTREVERPAGAVDSPAGAVDGPAGAVDSPAGAVEDPAGGAGDSTSATDGRAAATPDQVAEGVYPPEGERPSATP